jgi:hypothetical protein
MLNLCMCRSTLQDNHLLCTIARHHCFFRRVPKPNLPNAFVYMCVHIIPHCMRTHDCEPNTRANIYVSYLCNQTYTDIYTSLMTAHTISEHIYKCLQVVSSFDDTLSPCTNDPSPCVDSLAGDENSYAEELFSDACLHLPISPLVTSSLDLLWM